MNDAELDPIDIAASVLRPRRPRLAEALACVYAMPSALAERAALAGPRWNERQHKLTWTEADGVERTFPTDQGHFDAVQAWEAVVSQELAPLEWLDAEHRRFETRALHRCVLDRSMDPAQLKHPHTLKACVIAASDAEAMATVETLCAAAVSALSPWGARPPPSPLPVLWRFDELDSLKRPEPELRSDPRLGANAVTLDPWASSFFARGSVPCVRASAALGAVPEPERKSFVAPHPQVPWLNDLARIAWVLARDALRWNRAAREGRVVERVAGDAEFPSGLAGARFDELPNPFEPLCRAFALGYGVVRVEPTARLLACEP